MWSRSQRYRAVNSVVNPRVFQTVPRGPVSEAVPSDGIPCGKIDAPLCDCGLCPRCGRALSRVNVYPNAPPTPVVQICQLDKTPRSPSRLFSRGTLVWQVSLVPRSYLGLEPSWGRGGDRKVWRDNVLVSKVTQGPGDFAGSQFPWHEDTHTPSLDLYTKQPTGPAFLAMHRLNQNADHQGIKTFWRNADNSALRHLIL